ncbi:family 43 glycosylhydrolase [Baekduia soli]|uniref:Family 43 glycosylhydrolase n=1 Tax=Baekduia soli TaxID=496014 RepID=A0A5B8U078_9ACTN|nr:glycoside hydrolase family 43 protein [Baekduia soli]QEC46378.1 family 43 glycosylhydrolase [Baekduia soli]
MLLGVLRRQTASMRRLGLLLAALLLSAPTYSNPVIDGDHPDPSVVRVGAVFLASVTTSAWAPVFPLYRSRDLVNWRPIGSVLPVPPAWTNGKFWAPELAHEPGRYLAYWGAARRDGPPCIALSTAARPQGPWRYRGRVTCPPSGAIDAAPFRDVDGGRWLLWKQMGPGNGIRIQRLGRGGLRVRGPSVALVRPDTPWEQGVTEAPSLVWIGGRYLLFYAGGHCCRVPCSYGEGVAQAVSLLGPYVKDPANPILASGEDWACPGHGTVVGSGAGGLFLLHHAYRATDAQDLRRRVLLDPVGFGPDGWPVIGAGGISVSTADSPLGQPQQPAAGGFSDGFDSGLEPGWEWLFDARPDLSVVGGGLDERCTGALSFVARQVAGDRVAATTTVEPPMGDAAVGLAVNLGRGVRGVELRHGRVRSFVASPSGARTGRSVAVPARRRVQLTVTLAPGGHLATYVGDGVGGQRRVDAGPAASGAVPTRVALTCRGRGTARFLFARAHVG